MNETQNLSAFLLWSGAALVAFDIFGYTAAGLILVAGAVVIEHIKTYKSGSEANNGE